MPDAAVDPEPVPLASDAAGRLMVTGTRVPLDSLASAFERGDSAETVHRLYPTVALGDVYAIFTYCVRHRDEVSLYLAERAEYRRAGVRSAVETRFPPGGAPRQTARPPGQMTSQVRPHATVCA